MDTNLIGERLREARRKQKLKQTDLARMVCLPPETISRFENGHRVPGTYHLTNLCKVLGISADYILGLSNNL